MNPNRLVALLSSLPLSIVATCALAQQTAAPPGGGTAPAARPAPSTAPAPQNNGQNTAQKNAQNNAAVPAPNNAMPNNATPTPNNSPSQQPSQLSVQNPAQTSAPGISDPTLPPGTQVTDPLNPNNPLNANNPANPNRALNSNNATNPSAPNLNAPNSSLAPGTTLDGAANTASLPTRTSSLTILDANRDGYISTEEMAGNARARMAVAACDTDRDGKIASHEYAACTSGNQR